MKPIVRVRRIANWLGVLACLRWLAAALWLHSGCSYSFDSGPRELPISDRRVDTKQLPQLYDFSLLGAPPTSRILLAADGRPWLLSIVEPAQLRLVAIDALEQVWDFSCDQFQFSFDTQGRLAAVLLLDKPGERFPTGRVLRFRLGSTPSALQLPAGDDHLQLSANTVVSWHGEKTPAALHLTRWLPDDSVQTVSAPWPKGVDGEQLTQVAVFGESSLLVAYMLSPQQTLLQLVADGSTLELGAGRLNKWVESQGYVIHSDEQGRLQVYFVDAKRTVPANVVLERAEDFGQSLVAARVRGGFLVCSRSGLIAVDLDVRAGAVTGPPRVLDRAPCAVAFLDPNRVTSDVVKYFLDWDLHTYQVPFDGSAPSEALPVAPLPTAPEGGSVLSTCGREVVYSRSPPSSDANPAYDGWVRGRQLTQKGWEFHFSADCQRVRWREHAEAAELPSELLSARIEYGAITRLARSVGANLELPDGRLLVNAGLYSGITRSRLELIDEDLGEALLLLDAETSFYMFAAVPRGDGSAAQWEGEVLLESSIADGRSLLQLLRLPRR